MNPNDVAGALVGSLFFLSIAAVIVRQIENTTHVFTAPAHPGGWHTIPI